MPKVNYVQPCGVSDITITYPSTSGTLALAGGGGITGFTSSISTAIPNDLRNASRLLVDCVTTDGDIVLSPKGQGAILARLPDGTAVGGNKRGTNSVDLQRTGGQTQICAGTSSTLLGGSYNTNNGSASGLVCGQTCTIASGANISFLGGGESNTIGSSGRWSVLGGGRNNTANADDVVLVGGRGNNATGLYSSVLGGQGINNTSIWGTVGGGLSNSLLTALYGFIGGGQANTVNNAATHGVIVGGQSNSITALASHSSIGGGFSNTVQNSDAVVCGGRQNLAGNLYSVVCGGLSNTANGNASVVVGGSNNTASTQFSVAMGYGALTRTVGERAISNNYYGTFGDAQGSELVLSARTTNNTPTKLTAGGFITSIGSLNVPVNACVAYFINISVRQQASSNVGGWLISGIAENTGGTITLYNNSISLIHKSVGAWDVNTVANNPNATVDVTVTGSAANLQWVAYARVSTTLI